MSCLWRGSQDIGKTNLLIKNEKVTDFPLLKSNSPMCRWVCVFAGVFGGIVKEGVGSNVRWRQWGSQDLGKREMLKNEKLTNFPSLKNNSPAGRRVCVFAGVFGGIEKGDVGQM